MARALKTALLLAVLVAVNALLPTLVPNSYYMRILMLCGINIILAVSLNLVNGFTGQFSIGHAGFMAIGAYTSAVLTMRVLPSSFAGTPDVVAHGAALLVATLAGGLLAAVAGLAVG